MTVWMSFPTYNDNTNNGRGCPPPSTTSTSISSSPIHRWDSLKMGNMPFRVGDAHRLGVFYDDFDAGFRIRQRLTLLCVYQWGVLMWSSIASSWMTWALLPSLANIRVVDHPLGWVAMSKIELSRRDGTWLISLEWRAKTQWIEPIKTWGVFIVCLPTELG